MKKANKHKVAGCLLASSFFLSALSFPAYADTTGATLKLRVMETTDIHTNLVNYDYYKDSATDEFGLAKTASLINQTRAEAKNSILFDNGDLLQGTPLADYVAKIQPLKAGETHPAYKAMNLLDYAAGNIGNHEFNYGLDFLQNSLKGANFPYVNANIYVDDHDKNPDNDKNFFTPYIILEKTFKDEAGKDQKLKIGVIGFVPPQVMQWDKANLEGKVIAKDIVETAKKFVPEIKAKGADLIIAIPHSGIGPVEGKTMDENASYQLSKVPGIDAILYGHSHTTFPGQGYDNIPGVDPVKGTFNGIAAVQAGVWGDHLGIIDMTLQQVNGKWKVVDSQSQVKPIYDKANKKALAEADQHVVDAVKTEHDATINWVRSAVGTTTAPIHSFFSLVQDDPSIQIVTTAQKWYVEKNVKGTELEGLPILSAGAPFKAGGRNGSSYYTNIPAGTIALKNVSDLYIYPNTIKAVKMTGAQVKEWLEMSAGQFNQIDPNKKEEQPLINNAFPTYNFDVIDGVTYQIDVTEPAKYSLEGNLVNEKANRIKNLKFNGADVKADQVFLVVTNNYRASGGGHFPGLDGKNIVLDSPDENRQAVADYILATKTINPTADNNWSIAPINGNPTITFETSPDAKPFADKISNLKYISTLDSGFAKYQINLSKK